MDGYAVCPDKETPQVLLSLKATSMSNESNTFIPPYPMNPLALQCQFCFRTSNDLRVCTGCRGAHYCNSDCQKRDWKSHRDKCKKNSEASVAIKALSKDDSVKWNKVTADLKEWKRSRAPLLTWAAIQGLKLYQDPSNALSKTLHIVLERNSSMEPSRGFDITEIVVSDINEKASIYPDSTWSDIRSEMLKGEEKRVYDGGIILHVVIHCGKMTRVLPQELGGGIAEAKRLEFKGDWESVLKRTVLSTSNFLVLD